MLELTDLTVARGSSRVVDRLSLTIRPGHVFWIVGPNGAGKTSLVRVLAGLDRPAGGAIRTLLPDAEPLLYFHSEMRLPPTARVGDWERLARRLLPPAVAGRRTALWPEVPAGRQSRRLSTGERKRLLLDVLLRRPCSVLLDEPFEHLSPDGKRILVGLLQERARRHLVVVATNQETHRASSEGGLRLEGGVAAPLGHVVGRPGRPPWPGGAGGTGHAGRDLPAEGRPGPSEEVGP